MADDYHAILGVRPDAPRDEILHAYSELVKKFHPDHNHARNAEGKFRRIQHAFEMLYEPERHQQKVGAFHTDTSALLRVRSLRRNRGSPPEFSQGFATPVIVLLTVLYVLAVVIPFWSVMVQADVPTYLPAGSEKTGDVAVMFFALATVVYVIAVVAVIGASRRQ
jgi:hypothetical protein